MLFPYFGWGNDHQAVQTTRFHRSSTSWSIWNLSGRKTYRHTGACPWFYGWSTYIRAYEPGGGTFGGGRLTSHTDSNAPFNWVDLFRSEDFDNPSCLFVFCLSFCGTAEELWYRGVLKIQMWPGLPSRPMQVSGCAKTHKKLTITWLTVIET